MWGFIKNWGGLYVYLKKNIYIMLLFGVFFFFFFFFLGGWGVGGRGKLGHSKFALTN